MSNLILVYITVPTIGEAKQIAKTLIESKLAACANIVPCVHSLFYWHGHLQNKDECLLLLKSSQKNFLSLEKAVKNLHSYELPCIVALPLSEASKAFANWVLEQMN